MVVGLGVNYFCHLPGAEVLCTEQMHYIKHFKLILIIHHDVTELVSILKESIFLLSSSFLPSIMMWIFQKSKLKISLLSIILSGMSPHSLFFYNKNHLKILFSIL